MPFPLVHSSRGLHTTRVLGATGIKEFVPKWLRREDKEEELSPEDLLGLATQDMLALVRKPSDKFRADYHPPEDLVTRIEELSRQILSTDPSSGASHRLSSDERLKFEFLSACVDSLGKRIPNSFIDDLDTVDDVVDFFSRPQIARERILERMRDDDATPNNVHVIPDYMTFDKEMELHEGRDVYPQQDIIVSSLRDKGKYKSVRKPKCPWEEAQGFDLPVRYRRHKGY